MRTSSALAGAVRSRRSSAAGPAGATAAGQLAAEEHVHVDRLAVGQREVLMDHLASPSSARRSDRWPLSPVHEEPSAGRTMHASDDLHQRGLARAVVAHQRDDLARRRSSEKSSSATTPPNLYRAGRRCVASPARSWPASWPCGRLQKPWKLSTTGLAGPQAGDPGGVGAGDEGLRAEAEHHAIADLRFRAPPHRSCRNSRSPRA